jgi:glutamate--cysteine ligase
MPSKTPILRQEDARRLIASRSFSAGGDRGPVGSPLSAHAGVEVEWLTVSTHSAESHIPLRDTRGAVAAAGTLPGGCRVTFEPGGQLELSSPADLPSAACQAVAEDAAHLRRHLADYGITLVGMGRDPLRPERRVLETARYVAMERYFDATAKPGAEQLGRTMMCATASVQANLDLGSAGDVEGRWRRAHAVGPTLAAAFANSPFQRGAPSGWRSTRLGVWQALDASRTSPVPLWAPGPDAWATYAFNARVMLIRTGADAAVPVTDGLTFGEWLFRGHELGYPDAGDVEYHLSTLFPPIRPRGWLELRMIDSLPDPWWRVPPLVASALVTDPEAAERASRACAGVTELWTEASRVGLGHPGLAAAAAECFEAAIDALPRIGAFGGAAWVVEAFYDRFTRRGRCPADDLLDAWASTGALFPNDQPLEPAWT